MKILGMLGLAAGLIGCAAPQDTTVANEPERKLVCTIEPSTGTRIPSKQCQWADVREDETRVAREILDSIRPPPLKSEP